MIAPAPPNEGGTKPKPPSALRSPVLREHGDRAARESYRRIFETWPEMYERYGERGRQFTAEDNYWHLNFLDTATRFDDPAIFDRYADWLVSFMASRGITAGQVAGVFGFLADDLASADIPPGQADHRDELIAILRANSARVGAAAAATAV